MQTRLSVLMITKNAGSQLTSSLSSVAGFASEVVVIDDYSQDDTVKLAEKFGARTFRHHQETFGQQRSYGLSKCSFEWVLMLDADEVLSDGLKQEIKKKLVTPGFDGYQIPFMNHFLGHPLTHGGEVYSKLILFSKNKAKIVSDIIHERAEIKGKVGQMQNPVLHYSYRSMGQMLAKFYRYAKFEAERKRENGETSNLFKLITHPVHMFYARYFKDKGYQDHYSRMFLDIGFAYMEFLTYFFLLLKKKS